MKKCLDPTWQSSNWSFCSTWKGCYNVRTKKTKNKTKTILVHIKWNIVKTMNVNVKNPTKPYSDPPYIQEKTDKRVSLFLFEYYKNLIHFYGALRIWYVRSYRGRGHHTSSHRAQRSEITTRTFWGRGHTMKQDTLMLVYRRWMLSVFGVFICQLICRACMGLYL